MPIQDIRTQHAHWSGIGRHAVMAETNQEETARLNHMMALYRHLRENVYAGNKLAYDKRVEPDFVKRHGRKPKDRHEIREAMLADPFYRLWAHLRRDTQETVWMARQPVVERQRTALAKKAHVAKPKYGSLHLDPDLKAPRYQSAFDMHWMPGGYHADEGAGDVAQAAIYDLGSLYVSTGGKMGPWNDGPAQSVIRWLKDKYPAFQPKKLLDEGCTVGHSTVAYCGAWPGVEVHGLDFSAPVVRYAHARAESLGRPVHYHQALAEDTKFPDASFDLVLSSMFLHETSRKAVYAIAAEARRILKPGGLMLHVEQPQFHQLPTPWSQFENDWDTHNNNEPFWGPMHDMDLEDVAMKAGFRKQDIFQENAPFIMPRPDGRLEVAKGGYWFFFGAWKR